MTHASKTPPSMPRRMSAPKAEDTKPSKIIAIFWWVVFIVPVVFSYFATQSLILPLALIAIRVVAMFIPAKWFKRGKEPVQQKDVQILIPEHTAPIERINAFQNILKPCKEEAVSEWRGLMKLLHIYDYEKEDRYLDAYRKLREWDK